MTTDDALARDERLLTAIREHLPELEELFAAANEYWTYEDAIYRFYHQSWKVYRLQELTQRAVEAFRGLSPDGRLNACFEQIVSEGTNRQWETADNDRWLAETRPLVEAFFHAKYFLEMMCKYGRKLEHATPHLPSGWACVLYLYNQR